MFRNLKTVFAPLDKKERKKGFFVVFVVCGTLVFGIPLG